MNGAFPEQTPSRALFRGAYVVPLCPRHAVGIAATGRFAV